MVRVRIDDATWEEFKYFNRNHYLSNVLGELVAREVRKEKARAPQLTEEQISLALSEARGTVRTLESLVSRIETMLGANAKAE